MNKFCVRHAAWFVALAVLVSTSCGSPTEPDPRVPPPVGTPTRLLVQPCEYLTRTTRCPVDAIWGDLYRSTRVVTTIAAWSSDTPAVINVVDRFTLQAVAPGTAAVTVEYEGRREIMKFRVLADGPPWRVYPGERNIQVRDAGGQPLEGVTVELLTGPESGQTAVSNRFGTAIFVGESTCGPVTARATKPGFRDWTGAATNCGRAGNGNWGSEALGPVVMTPA